MTEELEKEVRNLRERVEYLEQELEISLEEKRFESSGMGGYCATIELLPEEVRSAVARVEEHDGLGWQVVDSDDGTVEIRIGTQIRYD